MALSYVGYTGNGSNRNFSLPFLYIDKDNIAVYIAGVLYTGGKNFDTPGVIQLATAPANGAYVEIRRTTQKNEALVNFTDGSTLSERDLDLLATQMIFIVQECFDTVSNSITLDTLGRFNAGFRKIGNVAPPESDNEVVTKIWAMTNMASQLAQAVAARNDAVNAVGQINSAGADAIAAKNTAVAQALIATNKAVEVVNNLALATDQATLAGTRAATATGAATTATSKADAANISALDAAASKAASAQSVTDAALARNDAQTARANAITARDVTTAARDVTTAARDTTLGYRDAAATSAGTALTERGLAQTARTGAETAKSAAETALGNANTAKTGADTAKTGAEAARDIAVTKAGEASTSATSALSRLNDFRGRYYGALAGAPSMDPLGAAIDTGDLYYDTGISALMVYSGTVWNAYNPAGSGLPAGAAATLCKLSLASGIPTTTTDVVNSIVYLTPNGGTSIVLFNGTAFTYFTFSEQAVALNTSFHLANSNYDVFAFFNGTGVVAGTGPAWVSATARGTGAGSTELENYQGRMVNRYPITIRNGTTTYTVPARQGLYTGAFRTTLAGTTEDTFAKRFLSNYFEPTDRLMQRFETAASWAHTIVGGVSSWLLANVNAANKVEWFSGMPVPVHVMLSAQATNNTTTYRSAQVGIGLDRTNGNDAQLHHLHSVDQLIKVMDAEYEGIPGIGYHYASWLECCGTADIRTFYGTNLSSVTLTNKNGMIGRVLG